jgi:hypothetical protein
MTTGKLCPNNCGNYAVQVRERVMLLTSPPRYRLSWWCECGYEEDAGEEVINVSDRHRYTWAKFNRRRLGQNEDT